MNVKETYLYFAENESADGAGDSHVYPASTFLGVDPISDTTTRISFKALAHGMSDTSGELVVFADEDNTIYHNKLRELGCIDGSSTVVTTLG